MKIYISEINQFNDESLFRESYDGMDDARKAKIDALRMQADKNRSLAAGVLLHEAVAAELVVTIPVTATPITTGQITGLTADSTLQPEIWDLGYKEGGKPYLKGFPAFFFNLSHSGDYAICVTADHEIGADIQQIEPYKEAVAKRVFTKEENEQLKQLTGWEQDKEFTRLWAVNESLWKLSGEGLGAINKPLRVAGVYSKSYEWQEQYIIAISSYKDDFPKGI